MRHNIASDMVRCMEWFGGVGAWIAEIDARSTQIGTFARAWGVWGYKLSEATDGYPLAPVDKRAPQTRRRWKLA